MPSVLANMDMVQNHQLSRPNGTNSPTAPTYHPGHPLPYYNYKRIADTTQRR
jgi:hypothetical protein